MSPSSSLLSAHALKLWAPAYLRESAPIVEPAVTFRHVSEVLPFGWAFAFVVPWLHFMAFARRGVDTAFLHVPRLFAERARSERTNTVHVCM